MRGLIEKGKKRNREIDNSDDDSVTKNADDNMNAENEGEGRWYLRWREIKSETEENIIEGEID